MSEYDANARFLRESIVEPDAITRARAHAIELGAVPISAAVGSQIAVLAAATGARSIVEIGTGAGVSGLWLLRGAPQAVLTSIDNEPEHLATAGLRRCEDPVHTSPFHHGASDRCAPPHERELLRHRAGGRRP